MPAPTQAAIQQALSTLQNGLPLSQKDFFDVTWGFAFHPSQNQFLLQTNAFNKKLAETLIVFRKRLNEAAAADDGALEPLIDLAFLHYIVNTDGQIPTSEGEDPFDVFEAAARYAEWFSVGVRKQEDGTSLLEVDDKTVPCPKWGALPGWSAAWSLRKVGPTINKVRYGREDVIPSFAFGFDENAEGHTLENAMTLADFSHLAYFGPAYVQKQLKKWGYDAFRWAENAKTDTQAFVAGKDNHLVACFRGTSSKTDALVDTNFFKTDAFGGRGRVHRGFNNALDSVWGQMKAAADALGPDKKLFVCGHSLGAALAQLAAHRFALEGYPVAGVYVYGSPRVGNREFTDAYNELLGDITFLHINNKDIVTQIPPRILGFRHLGSGARIFDKGHVITRAPKPKAVLVAEEEEMDFEDLDEEQQEEIRDQMWEAQKSIEASARFLTTPPELLEAGNYKSIFEIGPVDDHSMNQYLFKFGCAIVDGEWTRIGERKEES